VETLTRRHGYHAAGFLTYEAGAAFGLAVRNGGGLPLAWFALFEERHVREIEPPPPSGAFDVSDLNPSREWPEFRSALDRIRQALAEGDTYQVNFTLQLRGRFEGDPHAFFADLAAAQQGRYAALIRLGSVSICSASPELFLARHGSTITARPMKGTMRRGRSVAEDAARADELRTSAKDRAENVMVVDMVRNDLGRIAETGSVEVGRLFAVERYPTLWQMTSEITARTSASLGAIFAAAYPSASITGAPKVRTMEIIRDLEAAPRGVYTGTIGYVAPDGRAQFNVAIRTAVIDHATGSLTFGVGSGVVWDSDPEREYEECLLKAEVLRRRPPPFELLETMKWTPVGGFFLLDRHLDRMRASAEYFGIDCPPERVRRALDAAVAGAASAQRVRLLLGARARVRVDTAALELDSAPARVALAAAPIDPSDVFLFHKTTNRSQYEGSVVSGLSRTESAVEPILWNPQRQVTESPIANVVVERNGRLITPPVECGLLAGTFRAELLAQGVIEEGIVSVDDLPAAERIWLINSVREWREAVMTGAPVASGFSRTGDQPR
jgi:para-aminobenzoate synthetase/4-amino-4-deoxychorismate lyase